MKNAENKTLKATEFVLRFKKKSPEEIVRILRKKYPQCHINEEEVKKIIEKHEL